MPRTDSNRCLLCTYDCVWLLPAQGGSVRLLSDVGLSTLCNALLGKPLGEHACYMASSSWGPSMLTLKKYMHGLQLLNSLQCSARICCSVPTCMDGQCLFGVGIVKSRLAVRSCQPLLSTRRALLCAYTSTCVAITRSLRTIVCCPVLACRQEPADERLDSQAAQPTPNALRSAGRICAAAAL
jgi:hypothetical protein